MREGADKPESQSQNTPRYFIQFLNAYVDKNPEEQKTALNWLVSQLDLASIASLQFGQIIHYLSSEHIINLCNAVLRLQPTFPKNSTELTQICAAMPAAHIPIFCNSMQAILERRGFIDNAREFLAIFSPRLFLADGTRHPGLTIHQLQALFHSIKFMLEKPGFFSTASDFANIFLQAPDQDSKIFLFNLLDRQLSPLASHSTDIHNIAQVLHTTIDAEKPLFKIVREKIFREIIRMRQLPHAFSATLFLIADNYPGAQKDKLENVIQAAVQVEDSGERMVDEIIAKTKFMMEQEKITSTRLRRALTQLLNDIEFHKPIDIDYIIAMSQHKNATRFFQEPTMQLDQFYPEVQCSPRFDAAML